MKRFLPLLLTTLLATGLSIRSAAYAADVPQGGVGLVLSGGGAKGMAHIGLIRALEENDIPIDYIAGTSIGAVIGSMYVMGYSPDEMVELLASEQFRKWYMGEPDVAYQFYFKQAPPSPTLFTATIDRHDSLLFIVPGATSLINPQQMNLGFIDIFSGASAACNYDFDSLFVPFRSVASDVFNKKKIVLKNGDLGDAVRASMSFPFVFKPIRVDSVLAYDGGIYDNYPYSVMEEEFHPEFIIGSIVSGEEEFPADYDMYGQIKNMIIQHNDYDMPDSLGIDIEFNMEDIGLLDFDRLQVAHDRGYNETLQIIDSIKARVPYTRSLESVNRKRALFKERIPEIVFSDIEISGVDVNQQDYMEREFRQQLDDNFDSEGLKMGYFRLTSDAGIKEIIPGTSFNPEDSTFTLKLNVNLDDKPVLHLGGGLSSSTTSQLYAGISYRQINDFSTEYMLEGQIGKLYKNAQLSSRFDLAMQVPMALSLIMSYSDLGFYNRNYFFSNSLSQIFNKEIEFFGKIRMSLPFLDNNKAEFSVGLGNIKDYYSISDVLNIYTFKYDVTRYNILGGSVKFSGTTLNHNLYPTSGRASVKSANIYTAREQFRPQGDKDNAYRSEDQSWIQMSWHEEIYSHLYKHLNLGFSADIFYSTRNFSSNYEATMMQAGHYSPTVNSKFMYDPNFRANQYVAGGIIPIYNINNNIHLRGELYGFLPIRPIESDDDGIAVYGDRFTNPAFLSEISAVARYGRVTLSLFLNSRSTNWSGITFGVTVGTLLLNEKFFD